jgi:hypothetical protein
MHFVYDEVPANKLNAAWWDGFRDNHTEAELTQLKDLITDFTKLFADTHEGDEYWLDYHQSMGTRISLNGKTLGTIPGADFNQALLRIWLGNKPVTKALKEGMLGID